MAQRPEDTWRLKEPPLLLPDNFISVLDAVSIVQVKIPSPNPRVAGCSPAEHFLRTVLSRSKVDALLQFHFNGQCVPMPPEAWSEPAAPMIFNDGMVPIGGAEDFGRGLWASVRINELQLRNALSDLSPPDASSGRTVEPKRLGRKPSYDWAAIEKYAYSVLQEHGMPTPDDPDLRNKASLERKVLEYCRIQFGSEPAVSGLRPKLTVWLEKFEGQKSKS